MNEYTASNGIKVRSESQWTGLRRIHFETEHEADSITLTDRQTKALIEALDHEHDEELGRWRWPENPDYVVYPLARNSAGVVREKPYTTWTVHRNEASNSDVEPWRCALAYFDAHPEPKPWLEAKQGEVWLLTVDGNDLAAVRDSDDFFTAQGGYRVIRYSGATITAGRRIFPESV